MAYPTERDGAGSLLANWTCVTLLTPKQMRHGCDQPPKACRDGGQIQKVQVRALQLFLHFGKTWWDSKELWRGQVKPL